MDKITQSLTLDLVEISHNVVNARQNDKLTRDLLITITNNGREYGITDDSYVYLRTKRADGKSVLFPAKILENNIIHIDIPNCLLSCAGRRMLDVVIYHRVQTDDGNDSDMIASTEPFILYVPDKIFDEKEIAECDEANALAELILSANDAINETKQATNDLQDKLDTHHFVLTEDKDVSGGVPSLDDNAKVQIAELYEATTTDKGITMLTDSVTSNSTTTAATPNSVKTVKDGLTTLTARLNALADSDDTTLDQLSEIVAYIKSNRTLIENVTTNKVNVSDIVDNLTSTTTNKPLSANQGKVLNDLISALTNIVDDNKSKLDGIAAGAEVNQNTFSNVAVYDTTIAADSKTDTLSLEGSNITLSTDATNDKITIGVTRDNIISALGYTPGSSEPIEYTAGTGISLSGTTFSNSGVRSIATGSSNGTISVNTNGTSADVAVKGLGSAAYTASSSYATANHSHNYLPISGGTMTGTIYFNGSSATYPGYISHNSTSLTIKAPNNTAITGTDSCGLVFKSCYDGILPLCSHVSSNMQCLGSSTYKFGTVYSTASALNSDQKLKKDIESLDIELDTLNSIFDNINFVKFRWKDNNNGALETKPSCRYHYGVIAQEIEELMHKNGLTNYDNGFIHSNFFLDNTTGCYITGGYREPKDGYDYSQNVWNYKNNEEYEIYNEVIEKKLSELDYGARYKHRPEIQYILIQDISKVRAEGKQPPLTINSIHLIDKEGNSVPIHLSTEGGISCYNPEDKDFENPGSSAAINDNGSITISFYDMWSSYMIKIADDDNCYNFYDYESIIADVDFIGEYKIYLIPKGDYQTCDFWNDRDRTDEIAYDYTFNYQELTTLSLEVLQQTRKDYIEFKEVSNSKISELESKIKQLENK